MFIYLFFPFLLTTELVKAESPPVSVGNSENERTLHGPVPSFLLSLPCPSEGYFRHPKYCSQFYRCVDVYGSKRALSLFRGTCDPGLVFDEKISSCNWPDLSSPCTNYGTSRQPAHPAELPPQSEVTSWPHFPSPSDEKNGIVQEVFEVFTEIPSTKPSLTTEKHSQHQLQQQQPVQEEEIWQQLTQQPQRSELEAHQQQTQQEIWQGDQRQGQQHVEQQHVKQQVDQQHVQEQQNEAYPPIETLVQSVEELIQQKNLSFEGETQHFGELRTVDYKWWIPEEEKPVQQDVQNIITTEELLCSKEGFFQHPGNCSKFYRCVRRSTSFEIFVFECPQFLVFNQSGSACSRSNSQACVTRESAYRSLRSKRSALESTGRFEALTLPCPEEGFFRHPRHCQVFYRCVQSRHRSRKFSIHTFVCPKSLVFDEKKGTCDWPEKSAPCSDNSMSIRRTTQQPSRPTRQQLRPTKQPPRTTRQPSRTTQHFRATRQPSSKQKSKNNNESRIDHVQRRPNIRRPTSQGRDKLKLTQSTERPRTQTQVSANPEVNCRAPGFFTNRSDCNRYYKCVDRSGKGQYFLRYDFACPQNLAFDEMTSTCKSPDRVSYCRKSQTNLGVRQDDDPPAETSSSASVSEEAPATEEQSSKSTGSNSSKGGDKECKEEGYFRDPQDCNKFYRCVDFNGDGKQFVRYDFSCPEGLVFDEENSVCNWPSSSPECNGEGSESNKKGEGGEGSESNKKGEGSEGSESDSRDTPAPSETESPQTGSSSSDLDEAPSDSRSTEDSQSTEATSQTDSNSSGGEAESSTSGKEGSTSQETSSTSSSTDNQCTEEGYFRDPEDCNKFYRCVDFQGDGKQYVRYDFKCPEGLVFDETNSVCNWPSSTDSCESGSSSGPSDGGKTTSDETSQSQSTSDSTSQGQSTSASSETSDTVTDSTTPEETDSAEKSSETSESSGGSDSTTESSSNTSDHTDSSEQESTSQTSSTSGSNNGECKEEGYFRDPEDCSKFYRCVDFKGDGKQFVRYDFSCPEGLEFDEVNSVCNWPSSDSPCSGSSSEGEGTQSPSPSSTSETDSSSGTDSTTSSSGEEKTGEESTESPDSGESSSQTESSTSTTSDATTSSASDTSTSSSDTTTASSSDATTSSTSDASTASSDSSETESGEEVTSNSSTSESSTSGGGGSGSNGECTEEGYFRDPDDCSKFYRCVDFNGDGKQFVRYDFECPEGLVFDEVNSVCNWPNMSPPCDNEPRQPGQTTTTASSEGTTDSETTATSSTTETTTEAQSETSTSGTQTSSSESQTTGKESGDSETTATSSTTETTTGAQSETSTSGTQTSSSESQTTDSSSSGTTPGKESDECIEAGYFRDPEDCSKFHRCVETEDGRFIRYDFQCPDGLVFDETQSKCNWPEDSPPCETSSEKEQTTETSSGSESTTKSQETESGSTSASTDSEDQSTTSRSSTTSSTESEECTEEGFFRDPSDCRKYYRCIENDDGTFEKQEFSCEEDEVFDPDRRFCDKKELNPSCPDSTTQGTESTDTTETTKAESTDTTETTKAESTDTTETTKAESTDTTDTTKAETSSTSTTSDSTPPPEESSTAEGEKTTTETSSTGSDSSSTSKSSASKECTEEGFFRDPDDCSKFYRCVDFKGDGKSFVRYDFDCPEGLVFDEENSVCNWPSDVPECESPGPGEGTSSPREESSSSSASQTDSSSTSSPTSQETSTSASPAPSEESTSSTDKESSDTTGTSESQSQTDAPSSQSSTTSSSSSTSSSEGGSKDIQCTEEGFFRHPDDCTKFYRCVDFNGDGKQFVRYDFECPEGLVFDETVSVCNWPQDSPPCETGSDTAPDSSTSSSADGAESSQESTSSTQAGTTQSSNSESDGQTTQTATDSRTTTASDTSRTTSSSSRTTTGQQENQSGKSECKEEGFFRDPDDCRKYYRCLRNNETGELEKKEYDCPEGTIFDEEGRYCNDEELSPPCNSSGSFECTEEGFFRDPEDCTKYIQCTKRNDSDTYEQKRFQCPEDHVFDEEGRYCNAKELSPPCDDEGEGEGSTTSGEGQTGGDQDSSSESFECQEEGFFRDPEDCTKYYQCTKNNDSSETFQKKKHSCPEDHVFDEEGRYCNSVDLAPPCDESESPKTTSDDSSSTESRTTSSSSESDKGRLETTDSGEETDTTAASSSRTTSSSSSGSSGQRKTECTEEGFFRNPSDCNKFYRCVDFSGSGESFVRYDFDCPEGLVFDEINSVCTWPTLSPPCENEDDSAYLIYIPTPQ